MSAISDWYFYDILIQKFSHIPIDDQWSVLKAPIVPFAPLHPCPFPLSISKRSGLGNWFYSLIIAVRRVKHASFSSKRIPLFVKIMNGSFIFQPTKPRH